MIVVIDNYDSFTYNLVHYIGEHENDIKVIRNDEMPAEEVLNLNPKKIIISPGPCTPNEAGISINLIKKFYKDIPILGVCLGHQAIAQAFGAKIINAPNIMHGKVDKIYHAQEQTIFRNLSTPFKATRYHSLCIDPNTLPNSLVVIANSKDKTIMAIMHQELPIFGLQFHPESIKTTSGKKILNNFLNIME